MRRTRFFFRWWGKRKTPNQNSHNLLFSSFFSLSAIHPPNSKTLSHSLQLHSQRSYVCDVNGFSMVKNSRKYYDDAAGILRSLVLSAVAPHRLTSLPPPLLPPPASASSTAMSISTTQSSDSLVSQSSRASSAAGGGAFSPLAPSPLDTPSMMTQQQRLLQQQNSGGPASAFSSLHPLGDRDNPYMQSGDDLAGACGEGEEGENEGSPEEELRAVLAVIRHGDRTPKQKMKLRVSHPALLALMVRHLDSKGKQAKLKSPHELQELLDVTRTVLAELEAGKQQQNAAGAATAAAGGGASAAAAATAAAAAAAAAAAEAGFPDADELREKLRIVRTVLEQGGSFAGVNRKAQLKPLEWEEEGEDEAEGGGGGAGNGEGNGGESSSSANHRQQQQQRQRRPTAALLILKHGGVLTHAGRAQAEALGSLFRTAMYPRYGPAGGGLLRLHSTYRHDLKIYSSDEGRVQTSAAAFTQGLLDLEGSSLTPILVSLVKKDASMLDAFGKGASEEIRAAKEALYEAMTGGSAEGFGGDSDSDDGGEKKKKDKKDKKKDKDKDKKKGDDDAAAAAADALAADLAAGLDLSKAPPPKQKKKVVAIHPMPEDPLSLLRSLVEQLRALVERLRQLCLEEPASKSKEKEKGAGGERGGGGGGGGGGSGNNSSSSSGPSSRPRTADAKASSGSGSGGRHNNSSSNNGSGASSPSSASALSAAAAASREGGAVSASAAAAAASAASREQQQQREQREQREREQAYSALTQAPREWAASSSQPCGGERLLLLYDRWRKLAKALYSEKKAAAARKAREASEAGGGGEAAATATTTANAEAPPSSSSSSSSQWDGAGFDISKIPDIYDSAKYDAIHNAHLVGRDLLEPVYRTARALADAVSFTKICF